MHLSASTVGAAVLGIAALYIAQIIVAGLQNPRSHVPGPWWARFTSIPAEINRFRGRRLLLTADLHRKYGPVVLFSPNSVYIGDVEGFQQIHRMGTPFLKGAYHAPIQFGGDLAIFSLADPKVHAGRRRLFARAFTLPNLRQNWEREIRAKVNLCVDQIKREASHGASDTYKWWRLLTNDVIANMAFGQSFGLLEAGRKNDYVLALEKAGLNIVLKLMMPTVQPLLHHIPVKEIRDVVKADDFIYDKGAVAVENLRNGRREQQTIFNNMLDAADKTDSILRDDTVRAEAAVFMVAGSDTTAVTLTYLFWAVLKRPDLQQRLEAEVANLRPDFTDEDVAKLPLVNNVIDETLRLYGPGNGPSVRYVPPGGATFHGIYLPEDTLVFTNAHVLHQDESNFADAQRFDESRFNNPTEEMKAAFQPFGSGTRACLAPNLARIELRLATAVFFRECKGARLADDMTDDDMVQKMLFFSFPKGKRCNIVVPR